MVGKLELNLAPRAVVSRVRRLVAKQVLVRELVENLGKRLIELLRVLDKERASTGQVDHSLDGRFERGVADAPSEGHHEQRRIACPHGALDRGQRRVAALVFAVAEDDQYLRPGCFDSCCSPRTMTSFNAVPPQGASLSTARSRCSGVLSRRVSVNMLSLNAVNVT